ncbi:MAG TPA: hypothetical protein VLA52_01220 [Thermohalobaculum sp.]|nr:hypothetical protein [Thermohalobaculum sp.]
MARPAGLKRWAALIFGGCLMLGVLLPVSFVLTILLVPLWRYVESDLGIESIGHSGPAEWCFWLVYGLLVVGGAAILWRKLRAR